jgi:predicted NUDIX family phosphoesterase
LLKRRNIFDRDLRIEYGAVGYVCGFSSAWQLACACAFGTIAGVRCRRYHFHHARKDAAVTQVQTECVLVVPTALLHRLGHFQGFCRDAERYLQELLDPAHTSYRPRHQCEEDPSYKQLIPYVIFRYRDPQGGVHLFQYTRGKGQGEGRLHSKKSVGIGGHISLEDSACETGGTAAGAYQEGMRRELAEEVIVETPCVETRVGLINDDTTPVGQVHLGVVHIFDVESPDVRPLELDIVDAGFRPLAEILADTSGFESWSQICLAALFA